MDIGRRSVLAGVLSAVAVIVVGDPARALSELAASPPVADDPEAARIAREAAKIAPEAVDPRSSGYGSLQLYREATGDSIAARFRYEGKLDQRAMAELSWFWRDVRDRGQAVWIDPSLFDFVSAVQSTLSQIHGAPLPLVLTSGFRTPQHNARLEREGAARNSMHLYGRAADLKAPGYSPRGLAVAGAMFAGGGIGIYSRFTHLDVAQRRCWPADRCKVL